MLERITSSPTNSELGSARYIARPFIVVAYLWTCFVFHLLMLNLLLQFFPQVSQVADRFFFLNETIGSSVPDEEIPSQLTLHLLSVEPVCLQTSCLARAQRLCPSISHSYFPFCTRSHYLHLFHRNSKSATHLCPLQLLLLISIPLTKLVDSSVLSPWNTR